MPRSIKEPLEKAAVIAQRLAGKSKSKIARDLHISRPTVRRILAEPEIATLLEDAKAKTYALLDDATEACRWQLRKKHNGNIGLELLKGVGILRSVEDSKGTTLKVLILNAQSMPPQEADASATDSQ